MKPTTPATPIDRRDDDDGVGPPARLRLGERERDRRERDDGDGGTADVEVGVVFVTTFGDRPRAHDHERGDRNVDEERPPPAGAVDEPATDERAECAGDAAERRPGADGPGPIVLDEAGLQDRQTPGREQRRSHTLQDPRRDQHAGPLGGAAQDGCDGEPDGADEEDPATAVAVAECAAEQDQGGECDEVAGEHPLERRDVDTQVVADVRQGDVDDGRVELTHRTRGNRGDERDAAAVRAVFQLAGCGGHVSAGRAHGAIMREARRRQARCRSRASSATK